MNYNSKKRFGIVGGLGAIGAADAFLKLIKAMPSPNGKGLSEFIFEQHAFREDEHPGEESASQNGRKIYVFDMLKDFEARKIDTVILPCFLSHTFIEELKPETTLHIVNIMDALRNHLVSRHPDVKKLGILTSNYVKSKQLFEQYFSADTWNLLYPSQDVQTSCVMPAIYAPSGIKAGHLQGMSIDLLAKTCQHLIEQGAELIVPGFAEVPVVIDALLERGIPILDSNQIYARYAIHASSSEQEDKQFKVGVVGGVGPAATVDFMNKVIRNTSAKRDQEHIKMVVEQNPQIPDRTENLIGDGADPTIALYSICKKLEAANADIIAIPCNTAHAFVDRIQPYLAIPVVNMLSETVEHIKKTCGTSKSIGLLATDGTIKSRVYHDVIEKAGLSLIVPDERHQDHVMRAIYGPQGVKAGFSEGECKQDLLLAMDFLVRQGAEILILGCTELPLLQPSCEVFPVAGKNVVMLDPTEILAKKCVSLSVRPFS